MPYGGTIRLSAKRTCIDPYDPANLPISQEDLIAII